MGKARAPVIFGVENQLSLRVLLGTTFIDMLIVFIGLIEREILPHHTSPESILMVHGTKTETKRHSSDIRQFIDQNRTPLLVPTASEAKYITVA